MVSLKSQRLVDLTYRMLLNNRHNDSWREQAFNGQNLIPGQRICVKDENGLPPLLTPVDTRLTDNEKTIDFGVGLAPAHSGKIKFLGYAKEIEQAFPVKGDIRELG